MKNSKISTKYKLIGLFVLVGLSSIGQQVKHGEQIKAPAGRFIGATSDNLIFWEQEGTYKSFKQTFEVVDRTTWQITEFKKGSISSENYKGYVVQRFIRGDYIYELAQFVKGAIITSCKMGLLRRRVSDFEQEGEIEWLGEYKIFNVLEIPRVSIRAFDDAFYVISSEGESSANNFVRKYDFDLSSAWTKELDILKKPHISLRSVKVESDGNVLIELQERKDGITKVLGFIVLKEDELTYLNPSIEDQFFATHTDYFYDYSKDELTGVYLITNTHKERDELIREGYGYNYYRWDSNGNVLAHTKKMFTYGDVWNDDARSYLNGIGQNNLPSDDVDYPEMESAYVYFFQRKNGNVIFAFGRIRTSDYLENQYNNELRESIYCFELDENGEFDWKVFVPRKESDKMYFWEKFLLVNDELIIINRDIEESFSGSSYSMSTSTSTKNPVGVVMNVNDEGIVHRLKLQNPKEGGETDYLGSRVKENGEIEYFLAYRSKKSMVISSLEF